jgi:hypothetical protein
LIVFLLPEDKRREVAWDMLKGLQEDDYEILVIGRRGFKDIKELGLESKANKLLYSARALIICLVNCSGLARFIA